MAPSAGSEKLNLQRNGRTDCSHEWHASGWQWTTGLALPPHVELSYGQAGLVGFKGVLGLPDVLQSSRYRMDFTGLQKMQDTLQNLMDIQGMQGYRGVQGRRQQRGNFAAMQLHGQRAH